MPIARAALVLLAVLAVYVHGSVAGGTDAPAASAAPAPPPASELPVNELRLDSEDVVLSRERMPGARVQGRADGVEPFSMIGVSATTITEGSVRLRVHTASGWGPWLDVDFSVDHAPDGDRRGSSGEPILSEPIWVREADGYEVSVPGAARSVGVQAHLVRDTGRPVAPLDEPPPPAPDPAVAARVAAADKPAIRSRASWGARHYTEDPLRADNLTLGVVHHSVTTNAYSPAEVPGIIRGIQTFHMDGNGWSDIAYNFVVDRFGVIWEGRAGGIGNAVIGGHSKGFNTGSTGVVALGEFGSGRPPAAMADSIGRLLGWKLFIHGVDPSTSTVFTSYGNETFPEGTRVTLPRIVGHRDTSATACPGTYLYSSLPSIRVDATDHYRSFRGPGAFRSVPQSLSQGDQALVGDYDGDGNDDVLLYGAGDLPDAVGYGTSQGTFTMVPLTITGDYVPMVADFNGDYTDDVFWYGPGEAYDKLWYGITDRTFARSDVTVNGVYEPVVGDWNDDDAFDIVWYGAGDDPDRLWIGGPTLPFEPHALAISGTYEPIVADYDGDAYDDVLWYGPGGAPDRFWRGRPDPGFLSTAVAPVRGDYEPVVGDFTGDQRDDILWYAPGAASDSMWSGRIDGTFSTRGPVSINGTYTTLVGDFNGGGYDDVLLYGPGPAADRLFRSKGNGTFAVSSFSVSGVYDPSVLELAGDARSDVLWYGPGSDADVVWLAAD